jgi:putative tricarboxylic transport membrane protein
VRFNDFVTGATMIVAALFVIAMTLSFPAFPGQNYGPAVFPRLLASLLILCGALLMIRGFAAWRAGEPLATLPEWARDPANVVSALLVLASALAYIFVLDAVGFVPLTVVVLIVLFLWFRVKVPVAVVTALVAAFGVNWFFASLMRVPLPRGLMDWFL